MPFEVSEEAKKRVYDLVFKEKSGTLTKAENSELKYYLLVEHIMRLAKAKAYKILS